MSIKERSNHNCIHWLQLQEGENMHPTSFYDTDDLPNNLCANEFGHSFEYPNHRSIDMEHGLPETIYNLNEITTHYARISYARSDIKDNNEVQHFCGHEINITPQPKILDINLNVHQVNSHDISRSKKNIHYKNTNNFRDIMRRSVSPLGYQENIETFAGQPSVKPQAGDSLSFYRNNTDNGLRNKKKFLVTHDQNHVRNSKMFSKSMTAISPNSTSSKKKKFYDPEDARKFIKEQRKQRHSNLINEDEKLAKLNKQIIKQRLEELNTNSRQILSKNLKKKEKLNNAENKATIKGISNSNTNIREHSKIICRKTDKIDDLIAKSEFLDCNRIDTKSINNEGEQSKKNSNTYMNKMISNVSNNNLSYMELKGNIYLEKNTKKSADVISNGKKPSSQIKEVENFFDSTQLEKQSRSSKTGLLEKQNHFGLLRKQEENHSLDKFHKNCNLNKENVDHEKSQKDETYFANNKLHEKKINLSTKRSDSTELSSLTQNCFIGVDHNMKQSTQYLKKMLQESNRNCIKNISQRKHIERYKLNKCSTTNLSRQAHRDHRACHELLSQVEQSEKPFIKDCLPITITSENAKNEIIKVIADVIAPIATHIKERKKSSKNNNQNENEESHIENSLQEKIKQNEFLNKNEKVKKKNCKNSNIKQNQYLSLNDVSCFHLKNCLKTTSVSSVKSLVSSNSKLSKNIEDSASNLFKYLLQPVNLDPKPYNFIVAVQKKLQSTTNLSRMVSNNNARQTIFHQQTSTTNLHKSRITTNSITKKTSKKLKQYLQMHSNRESKDIKCKTKSITNSCLTNENFQSSTVNSMISECLKNTSYSCECTINGDNYEDTTGTSSVLSQYQPVQMKKGYFEERVISSKAIENIKKAEESNAKTPFCLKKIHPYIDTTIHVSENLNNFISNNQKNSIIQNKTTEDNKSEYCLFDPSKAQIGLKKLLYDFNRSLSKVIECNKKFQNTIEKSHEILNPKHSVFKTKSKLNFQCTDKTNFESSLNKLKNLSCIENEEASNLKLDNETQQSKHSVLYPYIKTKTSHQYQPNKTSLSINKCDELLKEFDLHSKYTQKCLKVENKKIVLLSKFSKNTKQPSKTNSTNHIDFIKKHINEECGNFISNEDEQEFLNLRLENTLKKTVVKKDISIEQSTDNISNNYDKVINFNKKIKKDNWAQTEILSERSNFLENKALKYEKAEKNIKDRKKIYFSNKLEFELSMLPSHCTNNLSEVLLNYLNIGLYEKLITNKTMQAKYLTNLLKMREKALISRTKGQIAWLEVQKKNFKAKALKTQIAAIKKKQRGILMKMEKEREEIKRLIQPTDLKLFINQSKYSSQVSIQGLLKINGKNSFSAPLGTTHPVLIPILFSVLKTPRVVEKKSNKKTIENEKYTQILRRNYDLELSQSLELLLKKRENDLQKRREDIERLVEWHQRLDKEEAEVLKLEDMLFKCNNANIYFPECVNFDFKKLLDQQKGTENNLRVRYNSLSISMDNRLKEIDRSLQELSSIKNKNTIMTSLMNNIDGKNNFEFDTSIDYIRTTGIKLNKLWKRLTTQQIEKFESNRHYKLHIKDLERLYKNAKKAVLQDFVQDEKSSCYFCKNKTINTNHITKNKILLVKESSRSLPLVSEYNCNEKFCKKCEIRNKLKNFFVSSQQLYDARLQRSFSDTQIFILPKGMPQMRSKLKSKINLEESVNSRKNSLNIDNFSTNRNDKKQMNEIAPNGTLENLFGEEYFDGTNENESNDYLERLFETKSGLSNVLPVNANKVKKHIEIAFQCREKESNFSNIENFNSTYMSENDLVDQTEIMAQKSSKFIRFSDSNITEKNQNLIIDIEHFSSDKFIFEKTKQSPDDWAIKSSDSHLNLKYQKKEQLDSKLEGTHTIKENDLNQSEEEKTILNSYEDNDETQIEDMSLPHFEKTIETSQEEELCSNVKIESKSNNSQKSIDHRDEKNSLTLQIKASQPLSTIPTIMNSGTTFNAIKNIPDITNEVEKSCYQHIFIENQHLKQHEQIPPVPYMYVREIPNKPPPPYVPPAHGSPMTTIFPSENRIKDITYRCSHEFYCKMLKIEYKNNKGEKLPSVMEEKITNIYERIILDICREYLTENQEILNRSNPIDFYSQLAFFNPPDRLRCIQEAIYKEVRRCLAMDKNSEKCIQFFSIYGNRENRDHIGKIIIQEMNDEEGKWCNFHREENEVLDLIVEEMIGNNIKDICKTVFTSEGCTKENEIEKPLSEANIECVLPMVFKKKSVETASKSVEIKKTSHIVSTSSNDYTNLFFNESNIDSIKSNIVSKAGEVIKKMHFDKLSLTGNNYE